jgi:hypothetical protein
MNTEKMQIALSYWAEQTSEDKDLLCRLKFGDKKSYRKLTDWEIYKIVWNK